MEARDTLVYLSIKYGGDYAKITSAIRLREEVDLEEVERVVANLRCKTVTVLDKDYPKSLRWAIRYPFVLFYMGNLSLLDDFSRTFTVVGAREASEYSLRKTSEICDQLAREGYVIISGLARGIDTAALEAANRYGKAVAILGNGLDYYYPYENMGLQKSIAKNGLLISEYPLGIPPEGFHFLHRNRIVAAVGNVTLAMECKLHSGTMNTIYYTMAYGHDLGCLAQPASEDNGCNSLVKEGAALIEDAQDAIDLLDPRLESKKIFLAAYK